MKYVLYNNSSSLLLLKLACIAHIVRGMRAIYRVPYTITRLNRSQFHQVSILTKQKCIAHVFTAICLSGLEDWFHAPMCELIYYRYEHNKMLLPYIIILFKSLVGHGYEKCMSTSELNFNSWIYYIPQSHILQSKTNQTSLTRRKQDHELRKGDNLLLNMRHLS